MPWLWMKSALGRWVLLRWSGHWIVCRLLFDLACTANSNSSSNPLPDPHPQGKRTRSFWQRWSPAWRIKWSASTYRINFDLHRAGGLWLWLALLVFAWSSVYMNLGDTVYKTVMRTVSEFHEPWADIADLSQPLTTPNWAGMRRIAALKDLWWRQRKFRAQALSVL